MEVISMSWTILILPDFIKHHAWFEGDEVALPREDRMYLLGKSDRTDAKETPSDSIAVWS